MVLQDGTLQAEKRRVTTRLQNLLCVSIGVFDTFEIVESNTFFFHQLINLSANKLSYVERLIWCIVMNGMSFAKVKTKQVEGRKQATR